MERAESSVVLANILRTTPYMAYVASFTIGVIAPESHGIYLFCALMLNEASNHALKLAVKTTLGVSPLTARPPNAKDCGIFPTHHPKESKSSGMPSGHSQTAAFLASVLIMHITAHVHDDMRRRLATTYVAVYAALVVLSRTKYGGPYISVVVDGRIAGCHTVLQVVAGTAIGIMLGTLAYPSIFGARTLALHV